ncbi:MAG: glutaredoxin domain-containing protein [Myxococcota bacterium]
MLLFDMRDALLRTHHPLVSLGLVLAMPVLGGGCDDREAEAGPAAETLPPLELRDDTADLLVTWVDERGGTHTETQLDRVPAGKRDLVRVITRAAGHGALFYVANLEEKAPDGRYAVRTMARAEWERLIAERRSAYRAQHAPKPPPAERPGTGAPRDPHDASTPRADIEVIVYGASWCGPCHDAVAYLRRKGVRVVEHDIEREPARGREMQRKLRDAGMVGGSIPVIDVAGTVIQGFSPRRLDRALARATPSGTAL